MSKRMRPELFHAGVALSCIVGIILLVWALLRPSLIWEHVLVCYLLAINVTAFGYYGYDKGRARSNGSRVPEVVLHGLALLGGTIGCYAAMVTFRHKTIKGSFRIFFWLIVVFQVLLILALIYRLWKPA